VAEGKVKDALEGVGRAIADTFKDIVGIDRRNNSNS
jgi:hypothetical protein